MLLIVVVSNGVLAEAQLIGGRYAAGWLAMPPSAAAAALGGWRIDAGDKDPALAIWNPSSLNPNTDRVAHAAQVFLPTGASRSILAGGARLERWKLDAGAHLQFVDYGDFEGRDEAGNATADFSAKGYSLGVSASRAIAERLRVGLGVMAVGERIEEFGAFGLGLSGGLHYLTDSSGRTTIGVQFQNLGLMMNPLTDVRDPLPLDFSIGFARRLRYLPLRFGVMYRKIDRWNLLYDDPTTRDDNTILGGESTERSATARTLDNFGRHLALNAELLLGQRETVRLRAGYDRQRQREGQVRELRSLAGFSVGLGIHTRRWSLDYGHTIQHRAGGANHLSLLVDFTPGARRGGA